MSKIIHYNEGYFDLKFEIKDDGQVEMLSDYAHICLVWNDLIFTGGFGQQHHPYDAYIAGKDVRYINMNILCFSMQGEFLWKIQECEYARDCAADGEKDPFVPYNSVKLIKGELCAFSRDGWVYSLNHENGTVDRNYFLGKG